MKNPLSKYVPCLQVERVYKFLKEFLWKPKVKQPGFFKRVMKLFDVENLFSIRRAYLWFISESIDDEKLIKPYFDELPFLEKIIISKSFLIQNY